ncbi:hypothetical protein GCM10023314_05560 [Algibacter agarivorans]|uniref:OmpA-like domain-containing protein n=1 Tax=Algibacter agarivorans TaxID=1109741 RepID=A0ABP9GCQ2_9FLAO
MAVQSTYKHSFKEYLTKHSQNSIGVLYNLCGSTPKEKLIEEPIDIDNDGVKDTYDLCPNMSGLKVFSRCPDSDGDNIPDSLDKCPNDKNIDRGCPVARETVALQPKEIENFNTKQIIYFQFRLSLLDNNAKAILDNIIAKCENATKVNIHTEGHTDNVAGEDYNQTLSYSRANSTKDYMISKGIIESSITTAYFGEKQPAANNETEQGRTLNRRSDIKITIKND